MSEEIKKIIVDKKNAALKKFEEEIMKSVNAIEKLTQDQIEEMKKIQNEDINNFAFIKNYQWFSCSDAIKLWRDSRDKSKIELWEYKLFYKPDYQSEEKNNKALISEYWYGSYVDFWFKDNKVGINEKD